MRPEKSHHANFLSLIRPELVCMTTYGATSDDKVDIMANVDLSVYISMNNKVSVPLMEHVEICV